MFSLRLLCRSVSSIKKINKNKNKKKLDLPLPLTIYHTSISLNAKFLKSGVCMCCPALTPIRSHLLLPPLRWLMWIIHPQPCFVPLSIFQATPLTLWPHDWSGSVERGKTYLPFVSRNLNVLTPFIMVSCILAFFQQDSSKERLLLQPEVWNEKMSWTQESPPESQSIHSLHLMSKGNKCLVLLCWALGCLLL